MGSHFELIVVAGSAKEGDHFLDKSIAEIQRIEALLTEFSPRSQTSQINASGFKEPVTVSPEVYGLIARSLHISSITQGAFDITVGPLKKLYDFGKGAAQHLPSPAAIRRQLQSVGYQNIRCLPPDKVSLAKPGMRLSFAAIGKGYAADAVKRMLLPEGVASGVINASGDLCAWGTQPDGRPWKIGITHPVHKEKMIAAFDAAQGLAVATSGNYEQYFELGGRRYSHNIDPRSGRPALYLSSVSVASPSAELSDALATAVTIMGIEPGLHLISQLAGVHAVIVDENHHLHYSKDIVLVR